MLLPASWVVVLARAVPRRPLCGPPAVVEPAGALGDARALVPAATERRSDVLTLLHVAAEPAPRCDWEAYTDPLQPATCSTPAAYRLAGMRCRHLDLLCEHHAVIVLSPVVTGRPLLGITCSCGEFTPRAELSVVLL